MRSWPILALAIFSLPATAGYDYNELFSQSGNVSIDGVVEVPLLRGGADVFTPYVEVTLADESRHLFRVVVGQAGMTATQAFVDAAEGETDTVKFNFTKEEVETANISSFNIGGATFNDVEVRVSAESDSAHAWSDVLGGGLTISGSIGLASFSSIGAAIVPSAGVLRIAAAADSAQLVSDIGGTSVTYFSVDATAWTYNDDRKLLLPGSPVVIAGSVGGQAANIAIGARSSTLSTELSEGMESVYAYGVVDVVSEAVNIGAGDTTLTMIEDADLRYYGMPYNATIGARTLAGMDVAWDPSTSTIAFAPAADDTRGTWWDVAITNAEAAMAEGDEEEGDGEESAEEESSADPAAAAATAELALLYGLSGNHERQMELAAEALALNSEDCQGYMTLGAYQLHSGDFAGAMENLTTATTMWGEWYSIDLETRQELAESEDEDAQKPQTSACYRAEGLLGVAMAVAGDLDGLAALEIGTEEFSFLPSVAVGSGFIAGGDPAAALPAFLQTARLEREESWLGMGISQLVSGRYEQALMNIRAAVWQSPGDVQTARVYAQALGTINGPDAAIEAISALADADVNNGAWALVLAETMQYAGLDNTEATANAISLNQWASNFGGTANAHGRLAQAFILGGDIEAATASANAGLAINPGSPASLHALAVIAAGGETPDMEASNALLQRALAGSMGNPGYAALLMR
jgi:tetratricopeptide (TPR) repeat protein